MICDILNCARRLAAFPGAPRPGTFFPFLCLFDESAKTGCESFRVSQKCEMGAFSVVTLRVSTLKLLIPPFLRSIEIPMPSFLTDPPLFMAVEKKNEKS